jgi:hypothetical protein
MSLLDERRRAADDGRAAIAVENLPRALARVIVLWFQVQVQHELYWFQLARIWFQIALLEY